MTPDITVVRIFPETIEGSLWDVDTLTMMGMVQLKSIGWGSNVGLGGGEEGGSKDGNGVHV